MYSITESGLPSKSELSTATSRASSTSGTSERWPSMTTCSPTPSSLASASSACRSGSCALGLAARLPAGDQHPQAGEAPGRAARRRGPARRAPSAGAAWRPCRSPAGRPRSPAPRAGRPARRPRSGIEIPLGMKRSFSSGMPSISCILRRSSSETATKASARRAISSRSRRRRRGWPSNDQVCSWATKTGTLRPGRDQGAPDVRADLVAVEDVEAALPHVPDQTPPGPQVEAGVALEADELDPGLVQLLDADPVLLGGAPSGRRRRRARSGDWSRLIAIWRASDSAPP